jgi:hypothetical protein
VEENFADVYLMDELTGFFSEIEHRLQLLIKGFEVGYVGVLFRGGSSHNGA